MRNPVKVTIDREVKNVLLVYDAARHAFCRFTMKKLSARSRGFGWTRAGS
jgi:hypothetical protein